MVEADRAQKRGRQKAGEQDGGGQQGGDERQAVLDRDGTGGEGPLALGRMLAVHRKIEEVVQQVDAGRAHPEGQESDACLKEQHGLI